MCNQLGGCSPRLPLLADCSCPCPNRAFKRLNCNVMLRETCPQQHPDTSFAGRFGNRALITSPRESFEHPGPPRSLASRYSPHLWLLESWGLQIENASKNNEKKGFRCFGFPQGMKTRTCHFTTRKACAQTQTGRTVLGNSVSRRCKLTPPNIKSGLPGFLQALAICLAKL